MTDPTKISIITPAYNSEATIEATMLSLLQQGYPNLEYTVIDGGSTDRTPDIIKRYTDELHYWVSEPDSGMYDALQKGFVQSTGEIMGWLNSDDLHNHDTLSIVNQIFHDLPDVEWITSLYPTIKTPSGQIVDVLTVPGYHKAAFLRGEYSGVGNYTVERIQQESTFWRRSLWERAGGSLDTSLQIAGDFELWARFFQHAPLVGVRTILGGIVQHPAQMSRTRVDDLMAEERAVLHRYGASLHTPLSARLRQVATRLDRPFTRVMARLGGRYQTQIAIYDFDKHRWRLKSVYI